MSRVVGELPVVVDEIVLVVRTGGSISFSKLTGMTVRMLPGPVDNLKIFELHCGRECFDQECTLRIEGWVIAPNSVLATSPPPARSPWWKRWFT